MHWKNGCEIDVDHLFLCTLQMPKSTTAANSACDINPDLKIDPHQHKGKCIHLCYNNMQGCPF